MGEEPRSPGEDPDGVGVDPDGVGVDPVAMSVADMVTRLDLGPHPEGGWFRRTWTAPVRVDTERGTRATASAILFLLDRDQEAHWHRVTSDELWLWHGPGTLEVYLGGTGTAPVEDPVPVAAAILSGDGGGHPCPQVVVPADTWQRTVARGSHALATCVVSPEFRYDDWSLAD